MFVEKNKGFARILSREALGPAEKNVIDAVNQFFKSLELTTKQLLGGEKKLVAPPGFSAQFIVTNAEGIISRFISISIGTRNKAQIIKKARSKGSKRYLEVF